MGLQYRDGWSAKSNVKHAVMREDAPEELERLLKKPSDSPRDSGRVGLPREVRPTQQYGVSAVALAGLGSGSDQDHTC